MGNRNSSTAEGNQGEALETPVPSVILADDLQAEIVNAFQNKNVQLKWQNLQAQILANSENRVAKEELRKLHIDNEIEKWRTMNDAQQQALDDKVDSLRAQFADTEAALTFDVNKMEKKFQSVPKFGSGDSCLNTRNDLVSCYKSKADIRQCDAFAQAMELCTKQTVMSK
mmetsp:Transcript_8043/g.10045  ORF Transcript_8043/g.10045 Transcript_8043/m.10045 type:complete len:170 (-) Transcript_8043:844-1353(-)